MTKDKEGHSIIIQGSIHKGKNSNPKSSQQMFKIHEGETDQINRNRQIYNYGWRFQYASFDT